MNLNPKTIPAEPGVYLFKDESGAIIYVGKARNLRNRVSSYFNNTEKSVKTQVLVKRINSADYFIVDNETEALLLENKLIKQHSPKYNISLKDAKTYAYIQLTDEKFPRILSSRKPGKDGTYFGPYVDGTARHELVQLSIRLFKLRTCKKLPNRACLNYHIGLCTAPCIKAVSETQYSEQVNEAKEFLKGNTKTITEKLAAEMKNASASQKFELALEKRRQINSIAALHEKQKVDTLKNYDQDVIVLIENDENAIIGHFSIKKGVISGKQEFRFEKQEDLLESFIKLYYSGNPIPREIILDKPAWADDTEKIAIETYLSHLRKGKVELHVPERGEKAGLIRLAEKNAALALENATLKELQETLILPRLPRVIECFDISNLGTQDIVAAMTQWVDGKPNKSGYRKFEIRTVVGKNDDFASMREVIHRRYQRLSQENAPFPDLIIIDGGKGQLDSALFSLGELGLSIPIIALAKQEEEIYTPHEEFPKKFDKNSTMMLLLRQIRDSVHNFVLSYNRKKRQMRLRDDS